MNLGFWEKLPKPFLTLAPMEGVTDTVFRQQIIKLGRPDVVYTEFTNVHGMCSEGFEKVAERLQFSKSERPIVAQIWGTEPEMFYRGAEKIAQMQFDGIDINFGCPVREVIKTGACAAMISEDFGIRERVKEIIRAVQEGGKLPVSVKTRIGNKRVITEDWIGFLLEQKLAAITVHGRLAAQMSKYPADWGEVGKAVQVRNRMKSPTLIIGNGDVDSRTQAENLAKEYGTDGIMIGRGVFKNPAIFAQDGREMTEAERLQILVEHAEKFEQRWGGKRPFAEMRKNIKMYVSGFAKAAELRQKLMQAESAAELIKISREAGV
jgi:nifR3 family TIM-barrel protein